MAIAWTSASGQGLAKPGRLDPGFGVGGRAVAALDFGNPRWWYEVRVLAARMPDGRILVAGNDLVLQYSPGGERDDDFAGDGLLSIESAEGESVELNALDVDAQGRILAVATVQRPDGGIALFRFDPNGNPDPTFGGGDGVMLADFGLPRAGTRAFLRPTAIAADTSGHIVVAGEVSIRVNGYCSSEPEGFVARLDSIGGLDPSFGDAGAVTFDRSSLETASGLVLDPSGEPLFFGIGRNCRSAGLGPNVKRLGLDGTQDQNFGLGGWVSFDDYVLGIALDHSGRILVLQKQRVFRLLRSGAIDKGFGTEGRTAVLVPGARSGLDDLAVTGKGGVLVAGRLVHDFGGHEPRKRLMLARVGPRGLLDKRFGKGGITRARFGQPSNTVGRQVLLDGRGHAIVAGTVRTWRLSTGQGLALYRFNLKP